MSAVIRDARPDEIDDAVRLMVAVFQESVPPIADPSAAMREAFAERMQSIAGLGSQLAWADLLIAREAEGSLVGAVLLVRPGAPPALATAGAGDPLPPDWAALRLLAVAPAARGRGLGGALTEACIRRARDLGAPVLALHTHDRELARALYCRLGWVRAPDRDLHPAPGFVAEAYVLAL